ncbi:glutathione ABC transporter substrate-binding protein [Virgibacillus sp. NKC19-3]|uniref:glutathione ABC transporter substrate-binding protein n=1 Tax=Virgibacillus saliphilus TaxID=2831674 RepID=UPI001C9B4C14|nr:glutathione ABC transporter substrate-binding protein [Virgibacillus sp. NKC19-3]MBY7143159.1 glutathione ABC transporter substrate-binding protein [Virgibacillus sp. NKC19-3]
MKLSRKLILLVTILISVNLAACADEAEDTAGTEDVNEGNQQGGDLVIASGSDIVTLDPTGSNDLPSFNIQHNIFEQLVRQDENMEPQPSLAESWESIDDTTWEFKLREGVKFHDGSDFNADVVKANIERILDPDIAATGANRLEMISEVKVVDDYTVHFITEYPFSPLPAHLANNVAGMISIEQIEDDYAAMEEGEDPGSVINQNPAGTGYFKFEDWEPGQHIRLIKNEEYWDGEANLDSVTFKVVPEDLTRIAELETGDSHVSHPLSPSDIAQVETSDKLYVNRQSSLGIDYLGFNLEKEPFDDERVRQAISMAIDKEQIVEGIYDGVGITAAGPLAPDVFGYDESIDGIKYDPEAAQELLAEAGYEDGFSTTIWTNEDREREDMATNVQAQLAEIGIDVEVKILEWGAYLDETANGNHDMFVLGWYSGTGDADNSLYPLFHSNNLGSSGNKTFTQNDDIDAQLEEARQAPQEERVALYSELQEMLVEHAPMVYMLHKEYLLGVSETVKGLSQAPTQMLELKDAYIEE